MAKVEIMKMPSESTNVLYRSVGQQRAFGQDQVSNFWSMGDDALDRLVCYKSAGSQIKHAKVLEGASEN